MKYKYGVDSNMPDYDFETSCWNYEDEGDYLAEEMAEDYQNNHDGWEVSFPIELSIFLDGVLVGTYEVEREFSPTFCASKVKEG